MGTDAIWFGSPQDQIQAFRVFEISPESRPGFTHSVGPSFRTHGPRKRREMAALLASGLGH